MPALLFALSRISRNLSEKRNYCARLAKLACCKAAKSMKFESFKIRAKANIAP